MSARPLVMSADRPEKLFGCHVARGPENQAGLRQRGREFVLVSLQQLGEAEIGDFRTAVTGRRGYFQASSRDGLFPLGGHIRPFPASVRTERVARLGSERTFF